MTERQEGEAERGLLQAFVSASTKSINDPTPDNVAAADALWDQLAERWKQLPPVNRDAMNHVAEWMDKLQAGNAQAPDGFVQKAIEAGNRYLTLPTEANRATVDGFVQQLADFEENNAQTKDAGKKK